MSLFKEPTRCILNQVKILIEIDNSGIKVVHNCNAHPYIISFVLLNQLFQLFDNKMFALDRSPAGMGSLSNSSSPGQRIALKLSDARTDCQ